jgi:GNAT superfamily N-acetyltransferase
MTTIRKATPSDLSLLLSLENQFDRDQRCIVGMRNSRLRPYLRRCPTANRTVARNFRRWLRCKNAIVLIAEQGSRPIGFTVTTIEKNPVWQPARFALICYLFVKKRYRGMSISSQLVATAVAWVRRRRISDVTLTVWTDNLHARSVYKKWGFRDYIVCMWQMDKSRLRNDGQSS